MGMRDADYLKPDERPVVGPWGSGSNHLHEGVEELSNSHVVVDDIARDLAEAVRFWWSKHDCMGPGDCYCGGSEGPAMAALARFDTVIGGKS